MSNVFKFKLVNIHKIDGRAAQLTFYRECVNPEDEHMSVSRFTTHQIAAEFTLGQLYDINTVLES